MGCRTWVSIKNSDSHKFGSLNSIYFNVSKGITPTSAASERWSHSVLTTVVQSNFCNTSNKNEVPVVPRLISYVNAAFSSLLFSAELPNDIWCFQSLQYVRYSVNQVELKDMLNVPKHQVLKITSVFKSKGNLRLDLTGDQCWRRSKFRYGLGEKPVMSISL